MDTCRRVIAIDNRVDSFDEDFWLFSIARHNDDDFGRRDIVQNLLYSFRSPELVCHDLVDAKQPRHCQEDSEGPESEPL